MLPVRVALIDTFCGDAVVVKFFVLKTSSVIFKPELFKGFGLFVVLCSSGLAEVFVVFLVVFVAVFTAKPATFDDSGLSELFSSCASLSDKLST